MNDAHHEQKTVVSANETHFKNIEQIINQSDSVVYIRQNDINWSVTYISENISRIGYSPKEFYEQKVCFSQLLHPEDVARIKAEILFASHQKKNNFRLEYRLVSKSKEFLWVSDVLEIVRDAEGNTKHYQGVITDISYRKETEDKISAQSKIIRLRNEALSKANDNIKKSWEDLQNAHNKLAENEEKFKVISDQALLGIIIIQEGLIKYFNKAFISIISYTEDEVCHWKEYEFLKAIYEEDKKLIQDTIKRILNADSREEFHFEFRRITKSGKVRWLSQWSRMIQYENKRAILVTLLDVDERKKWQDALTESENRLRTKLDFILSPDKPIGDFSITDIFDIEQLQKIQDAFAVSHNVSSIITDIEGRPITRPSNFNSLCQLIRSTAKGMENCRKSTKFIGKKARQMLKPITAKCERCGNLDAGAPIIVGGKHVANWMIGQALDELPTNLVQNLASEIEIDTTSFLESSKNVNSIDLGQFEKVVEFLWIMAKEISALGYNNLKLARDIEERKKIEIALRESEELYRQLVHTSPDGIALVDLQGKILYVSPKAKQLFGYPKDYNTEGLCIFNFIEPSYLSQAIANVTSILENNISYSGTYLMVCRDHSTFSAEVNSTPIKDYQGNTKGMISIIRDVTERKKVEEELIKAKNKAEESDRLKSAFLANMSHEIRTPMNGILGFASLLNDRDTTPKLRREYAEIINQNGNILLKLIDDILDIAKIEAGQLKIINSPFNLDQIMYEQYLLFKTLLEKKENKKDVKLILTLPEHKVNSKIKADQSRLSQILTNLLSNALKFTDKGSIEFGYVLDDIITLKFYVKDTGIGLPAEKSKIIFDRFRQADETSARRYGGTGLGLTISSNLVRLMGGNIWVDSEIGQGSTFYVTLPYIPVPEDITTSSFPSLISSPVQFNWSDKTILIAEDEYVNYLFLQELLKPTQVNILLAKDGNEAIVQCKKNSSIHLVLMDIKMPETNGYTATREIKQIRQNLPVIAQSAYAMEEEILKCKEAGCDDYISKPIDQQKLLLLIDSFFRRT